MASLIQAPGASIEFPCITTPHCPSHLDHHEEMSLVALLTPVHFYPLLLLETVYEVLGDVLLRHLLQHALDVHLALFCTSKHAHLLKWLRHYNYAPTYTRKYNYTQLIIQVDVISNESHRVRNLGQKYKTEVNKEKKHQYLREMPLPHHQHVSVCAVPCPPSHTHSPAPGATSLMYTNM